MDLSKLDQNEKLAVYGAVAAIVGMIVASFLAGIGWLTLLAGFAMLVLVFLPQFSAGTTLPGSKGSLMVAVGGIGAVAAVLALLMNLGGFGSYFSAWPLNMLFLLIGVAGGLVMGWAGWQELQGEGGKFQVGSSGSAPAPASSAPPPAATTTDASTTSSEPASAPARPVDEDEDRPLQG